VGYGRRLEQVVLSERIGSQKEYSDSTAREIDEEVQKILKTAYDRAIQTITDHRKIMDRLADELLEKEEVSGKIVMQWMNGELEQSAADDGIQKLGHKEEE